MKCFGIIILLVVACALVGLAVLYLGVYNVAATEPHSKLVDWTAGVLVQRSVERRAGNAPLEGLDDPALLAMGAEHYKAMCQVCHGGPGLPDAEIAQGLEPRPPNLARAELPWSDAQLLWIVKHGLKSAGMPAFGPTHTERQLKAMTAFVKKLYNMSPQEYAEYGGEPGGESPGGTHEHGAEADTTGHY